MTEPVRRDRRRSDRRADAATAEISAGPRNEPVATGNRGIPVVNGRSAETAIKGAVILLGLIILAITVIVVQGKPIPDLFTTLAGLLTGFVIGGRVVTTDAARKATRKDDTDGASN